MKNENALGQKVKVSKAGRKLRAAKNTMESVTCKEQAKNAKKHEHLLHYLSLYGVTNSIFLSRQVLIHKLHKQENIISIMNEKLAEY